MFQYSFDQLAQEMNLLIEVHLKGEKGACVHGTSSKFAHCAKIGEIVSGHRETAQDVSITQKPGIVYTIY